MRQVEACGEPIVITDHGGAHLEVRPYRALDRSPLDVLHGSVLDDDQPSAPVAVDDWDALARASSTRICCCSGPPGSLSG